MFRFIIRRLLFGILVLWLVTTSVFCLLHISPTPVEKMIAGPRASAATVALIRHNLGLDRPFLVQYWSFLKDTFTGDLGYSYVTQAKVSSIIADRLPATLWLVGGAAVLWFVGGVTTGVLSATRARSLLDRSSTGFVLLGLSIPPFLMALLLPFLFIHEIGITWFQTGQYVSPFDDPNLFLQRMILPWLGLAFMLVATYTRLTRGSMMDVLGEDYIRTARAKGLSERRVIYRHGLRAALTPIVTQFGVDIGALIGSTIVTEKVFGLQGIGQLVYNSIVKGDTPVILGVTLLTALFVVVANLIVDIGYSFLDPRVRVD
ncbi:MULTISPECIES: ABC transporter permease [Actinoallomurus]|uniref:ABC transporter permease n=1 Tax=Actinoallomurus TaxID=667113 RepID=UPI002093F602|nr:MULTISPECIES: ABC transporter permease [Actinoallomurus]MCO5970178.1 ABC transporter permease [Actinoallomurus soli]MCO5995090.1 ABC transporter permease [Actinoallomurus rhizosphaericola]